MNKKFFLALGAVVALLLPFSGVRASLYQFYNELGLELPSLEERALVAAENGIWGYQGTREQNILLEKRLREQTGNEQVGYSVVSRFRTTLATSMTSSQTTVPVASITTFDGTTLTMSLLGAKVFLTLEPGTAREEIVMCTAITSSQFSSCTRGLAFSGTSTNSVSANQKAHNAGSIVVMSNVHYVYEELVDKDSTEAIEGLKTVSSTEFSVGTGVSTTIRYYFKNSNSTSTSAFFEFRGGVVNISEDGINTYRVLSGGSGLTAGKGITINSSAIVFNPTATSTSGLGFSGSQAIVALSSGGGLTNFSDGLALSTTTQRSWTGTQSFFGVVNLGSTVSVSGALTFTTAPTFQNSATTTFYGPIGANFIGVSSTAATANATTTFYNNVLVKGNLFVSPQTTFNFFTGTYEGTTETDLSKMAVCTASAEGATMFGSVTVWKTGVTVASTSYAGNAKTCELGANWSSGTLRAVNIAGQITCTSPVAPTCYFYK